MADAGGGASMRASVSRTMDLIVSSSMVVHWVASKEAPYNS
jgi:hypothetical protein